MLIVTLSPWMLALLEVIRTLQAYLKLGRVRVSPFSADIGYPGCRQIEIAAEVVYPSFYRINRDI